MRFPVGRDLLQPRALLSFSLVCKEVCPGPQPLEKPGPELAKAGSGPRAGAQIALSYPVLEETQRGHQQRTQLESFYCSGSSKAKKKVSVGFLFFIIIYLIFSCLNISHLIPGGTAKDLQLNPKVYSPQRMETTDSCGVPTRSVKRLCKGNQHRLGHRCF